MALVGVTLATGVVALVIQFRIHIANDWQRYSSLQPADPPASGDRILVFAPHCDDETLGCGGMLSMARQTRASMRVVLITNGDGFRFGVAQQFKRVRVTPQMCIQYACRRQKETLRALRELGVPGKQVTFLGYPDRGILPLWNRYWDRNHLYKSNATKSDHSPYSNSLTCRAPYCGESLLADIERVITDEKPTDVYLPHPLDNHQDHYATYCFVTAAVAQLAAEAKGAASKIRMHTYLVHRGDWPLPKGDHPKEPLVPPHALARGDTKWYSLELPEHVTRAKRLAIRRYRSQTAIERGFLMSFARENEVFGSLPVRTMTHVPDGWITIDGEPDDWLGCPPVVVDPIGDYVLTSMDKGGDVRDIYLASDDRWVYVRVDCVRRLSSRMTYTLGMRGVAGLETDNRCWMSIRPPKLAKPPGTRWAYRGNVLEVAVPRSRFAPDETIFVQVQTMVGRIKVDNTGWHEVLVGK